MVAYSFAPMFCPLVAAGVKSQTVRGHRRRHARPGEPIHLYRAMRTRHCRKLVDPDPVCVSVHDIVIEVSPLIDVLIASIIIGSIALHSDEIEDFARADGFGQGHLLGGERSVSARAEMGQFWQRYHGLGRFEGVLIQWKPWSA
ncbi:ASCH domain-containing protein [Phyllobacterium leguminum]|uniref:Uncharacterized protein n=1 Tax=Phyllobacterium leguminum TaxID=314237 RepID=A0A318SXW5_9HYPH|nr:ASCH domain-containing protein [Phyllobacterium leguminum]PYE86892.1 hypothetical protein C7477_11830 [Phyllobacterium leguminum]